jgi:hypothetical protein
MGVGRRAGVSTSARQGHIDPATEEQAYRGRLRIAESTQVASNPIDPVLDLQGDAETVWRHIEDDDVGRLDLSNMVPSRERLEARCLCIAAQMSNVVLSFAFGLALAGNYLREVLQKRHTSCCRTRLTGR